MDLAVFSENMGEYGQGNSECGHFSRSVCVFLSELALPTLLNLVGLLLIIGKGK